MTKLQPGNISIGLETTTIWKQWSVSTTAALSDVKATWWCWGQPSSGQFNIVKTTLPINNFHVSPISCIKRTSCEHNASSHVSRVKQDSQQRETPQTEPEERITSGRIKVGTLRTNISAGSVGTLSSCYKLPAGLKNIFCFLTRFYIFVETFF